jgi:hypothetical protein
MLRSILGVLPCSILRIWRLWARTKNEYTMDDFSMLTIREPWLVEKNFYFYCFHLASRKRNRCYKVVEIGGMRSSRQGFPKDHLRRKGRLMKEFHHLLYERWLQVGTLKNNLAHTFTYFANLGFWQLIVWKVQYFSSWCYAYAGAVWCSWCTLEWLGYPYALMIGRAINSRERICVTSCYLTTKIPSALLVAVVWLQHTRYPRFRRGTFDYGVTTSSNKRGRVGVRSYTHASQMHMLCNTCSKAAF